jgi:hypothetical protein
MYTAADREGAALKDLGSRVNRVRTWVAALSFCGGLLFGVTGYILLREYFLEHAGVNSPMVTGAITIGGSFAVAGFAAKWVSRLVVRARRAAWIEAARTRHEVSADPLREFLRIWE